MALLDDCYVGFLNLPNRVDRRAHMENELYALGITAERTQGRYPQEFDYKDKKLQVMLKRTPGAVGCHMGQVEIMQKALDAGKHAMVFEDDCKFCFDFKQRLDYIERFVGEHSWDIFWLGGTVHIKSAWWHGKEHEPLMKPHCKCTLERDFEQTDDPHIIKTYGAFSTYAYIVNKDYIKELLRFLDDNLHISIGIDFLMILLQPKINSFMFLPGCVKQIDNMSDIGMGMTVFSGFASLGDYWYKELL